MPHLYDVKLAGFLVFQFKAYPYYVDELINWDENDVRQDPFYRLVFPILDMLSSEHRIRLEMAKCLIKTVDEICSDLNPRKCPQYDT